MTKNNPTILSNFNEKILVFSVGLVKTQYRLLGARAISAMNHCFLIHQQLGFLCAGMKKKEVTWLTLGLLCVPGMISPSPGNIWSQHPLQNPRQERAAVAIALPLLWLRQWVRHYPKCFQTRF